MDFACLAASFSALGYTVEEVIERIGELGQEGLGRNSTVPADRILAGGRDPQAALIRLFLLGQQVPAADLGEKIDVAGLIAAGILKSEGSTVRARADIRPYGSPDDGGTGWVVSDPTPGLDFILEQTRPDYVLGVSPASTTLAQVTARTRIGSALDLGTGCGVQSLHLARHAERVVATDVNRRALKLAAMTAELSGARIDFREGSLYAPVVGERFDLIVSNPPFVMSPPSAPGQTLAYRETNFESDLLVETLVREAATHLNLGGSLQLLTNWAVTDEEWGERLLSWAPPGCDMWVIERERLDPYAYIEMWLADAGLSGSPGWRSAYDEWLTYFERLDITSVGMGWIQVTRAERPEPHREVETWPYAVAQPIGNVFAQRSAAVTASRLTTDELLASTARLVNVEQEMIGVPGAEDPQHMILRQRTGLLRALQTDTVLAGVLGALDGELTVGQALSAAAQVLGLDGVQVAAEVLPEIRTALLHGMLVLE